ncbi:hypothetical protein MBLNU230_g3657t2 [Neophaeotheca triangularis]
MFRILSRLTQNRLTQLDETDPLLDSPSNQYGGTDEDEVTQPDEEDLRREREELEQITARANSGMVDVLYASAADFSPHTGAPASGDGQDDSDDAAEAAWLESVQAAGTASNTEDQGFPSLVMDVGQLRDERSMPNKSSTGKPTTTAQR